MSRGLTDWEVWAVADEMIRQHGADAPIHAAQLANERGAAGDFEGERAWLSILRRIDDLLNRPAQLN